MEWQIVKIFLLCLLRSTAAASIHKEAKAGKLDAIVALVEAGTDINQQDASGYSALIYAAQGGHSQVVEYLLQKGANIDHQDNDGRTALMVAALLGHYEVVQHLVKKGASVDHQNNLGSTPLMDAARYGIYEVVEYLVENGANVDLQAKTGYTALMLASESGHSEVARYLVEKGANINRQDNSGNIALMDAALFGRSEVVEYLVEKGANIDHQNEYGTTALIHAAQEGYLEVVEILVENGANVNQKDIRGSTALMLAVRYDHYQVVVYLVQKGTNINDYDNYGETPLWCAISKDHFEIACYLVGKGVDTNVDNFRKIEGKCLWKDTLYDMGSEWHDGEDLVTCQDTCTVVYVTPCMCNGHGDTCNRDTGRCNCHTKGVTGDHCDQCDTQNNYVGEPLNGTCFYELVLDYQFTFNLSKDEDRHIRQINFFNVPTKSDKDTDFDIQCSKTANIKISSKRTNSHESWIIRNFTGKRMKRRFSASEYSFGSPGNSTTFYVHVYNFTPPLEIIVSFSQHPKLDLSYSSPYFSSNFVTIAGIAIVILIIPIFIIMQM